MKIFHFVTVAVYLWKQWCMIVEQWWNNNLKGKRAWRKSWSGATLYHRFHMKLPRTEPRPPWLEATLIPIVDRVSLATEIVLGPDGPNYWRHIRVWSYMWLHCEFRLAAPSAFIILSRLCNDISTKTILYSINDKMTNECGAVGVTRTGRRNCST
jgi:hypothetical protein